MNLKIRACVACVCVRFVRSYLYRPSLYVLLSSLVYFEEKFRNGNERKIDQTPHKIPPHPPAHINAANTVQRKILRRCLRVQVRSHSSSRERAIGIGSTRSHLPGKRGEMRRFSSVPLILSFVGVCTREMI